MSFVIHVRWCTKYAQTTWDVYCRASVRQCPLSYMSDGVQSTHRLPGMSTVGPVSGNVLCRQIVVHVRWYTKYTQTTWDAYCRASIGQCPLSYMSDGVQSTHRLPGMSTVGPVSGNVLCHTCPMVYKVHTDYLGCPL